MQYEKNRWNWRIKTWGKVEKIEDDLKGEKVESKDSESEESGEKGYG